MNKLFLVLGLLTPVLALGQSYSIDWYKVSGGGGTSSGGAYSVTATIGQPDASSAMTGGNYSLTGGFWSMIRVVQTAGLPNLVISQQAVTSLFPGQQPGATPCNKAPIWRPEPGRRAGIASPRPTASAASSSVPRRAICSFA
jgi:hypothetical protein